MRFNWDQVGERRYETGVDHGALFIPNNSGDYVQWQFNVAEAGVYRLRVRYAELLREEVARTIGTADDVDEELHHLSEILIAAA